MNDVSRNSAFARFRNNRWASSAAALVGIVMLIAMLCPLLASQRPLILHATLRADYEDSLLILIEVLTSAKQASIASPMRIQQQVERVSEHLGEADRNRLMLQISNVLKDISNDVYPSNTMEMISQELDNLFKATLSPVLRFPAFRALTFLELIFVFLPVLLLSLIHI